jgi:hypothetical protein
MAFASLTIDLNARLANIEKDLGKSVHLAERSAQKMQAAFTKAGAAIGALGIGVSLTAFGSSILARVNELDEFAKAGRRAGLAAQDLAGLTAAFAQAGGSTETLRQGLQRLNAELGKARAGGTAQAQLFEQLGVSIEGGTKQSLLSLAKTFEGLPNSADRAALASRLFGEDAGPKMAAFLGQGSAAVDAQIAKFAEISGVTQEAAESAEKFNDTLDTFRRQSTGLGTSIATAILPGMNAMLQRFNDAITLSGRHGGFFSLILNGINPTGDNARELNNVRGQIQGLERMRDAMPRDADELRRLNEKIGKLREVKTSLEEIQRREALGLLPESQRQTGIGDSSGGIDLAAMADSLDTDAKRINDALRRAFDTKPMDDFIAGFAVRRQSLEKEYAQLISKLTGPSIAGADSLTLSNEITQGGGMLARGDAAGTEVAIERAKQMLAGLKDSGGTDFEVRYYADQLKRLELAVLDAGQSTAEQTRDNLQKNLEQAREQIAAMEPIAIPIAADAIANDLRTALDDIRKDLAANPLTVAVQLANTPGGTAQDLRNAALQAGGRR